MPWEPSKRDDVICRQVAKKIRWWAAEKLVLNDGILAEMSGVSITTVRHARSDGRVSLAALVAISEALGYDIEELISFTKEERDEWPERKEKASDDGTSEALR